MRRDCRERFPRQRIQRKPLVSDPSMHHGTCVTHVPWCMPGLLYSGGAENVPGIPGACATHNPMYRIRGPWYWSSSSRYSSLMRHVNIKPALPSLKMPLVKLDLEGWKWLMNQCCVNIDLSLLWWWNRCLACATMLPLNPLFRISLTMSLHCSR